MHGHYSRERHARSPSRRRLILTTRVPRIAFDPANARTLRWNPAGASLEQALDALGIADPVLGVIGGSQVFGLVLDRYDVCYLSRAPGARPPSGRPVFPRVPALTPEQVLAEHGLQSLEHRR